MFDIVLDAFEHNLKSSLNNNSNNNSSSSNTTESFLKVVGIFKRDNLPQVLGAKFQQFAVRSCLVQSCCAFYYLFVGYYQSAL